MDSIDEKFLKAKNIVKVFISEMYSRDRAYKRKFICDASNNTEESIAKGYLYIDVIEEVEDTDEVIYGLSLGRANPGDGPQDS